MHRVVGATVLLQTLELSLKALHSSFAMRVWSCPVSIAAENAPPFLLSLPLLFLAGWDEGVTQVNSRALRHRHSLTVFVGGTYKLFRFPGTTMRPRVQLVCPAYENSELMPMTKRARIHLRDAFVPSCKKEERQ